jgi:hypothetical protein
MKKKAKKELIVCFSVCLVVSFFAAVYAAPLEEPLRSAPVTVVNPNSKPIPVTEANKYPVQAKVSKEFPGVLWVTVETLYMVPVDKRLVIEYFSCRSTGSYSTSYSCCISTGTYPNKVDHCLPSTPYGHYKIAIESDTAQLPNPKAFMTAGQRVQVYAEPGTSVMASAWRQNQAIMNAWEYPIDEYMYFSFSGYLIDK